MARRGPGGQALLPALAWLVLLALLPWWLGLPLLLALAAALLTVRQRLELGGYAGLIRRALRWGLAGCVLASLRALGDDAAGLLFALLGALIGCTLLIALESWLDRGRHPAPAFSDPAAAEPWHELAQAPIGPAVKIIELQPPHWWPAAGPLDDPCGGAVSCRDGSCCFATGERIDQVGAQVAFSADGHWFAAQMIDQKGVILWDRVRNRQHRLRGRQLAGWYQDRPWLSRDDGDMPLALSAVLGHDDEA